MAKTTIPVSLGSGADDQATSGKISVRRVREGVDGDMLVLSAWKDYPVGEGLSLSVTAGELYESRELEPRGRTRFWYAPASETNYADLEDVFPLPPGEDYGPQGVGVLNATQPEAGKVAFQLSDGSTTSAVDLPDGTGVTDLVQPTPSTMALELTDGTTTDPITLPVGPGGSDAGVAGYLATPGSLTAGAVAAKIGTARERSIGTAGLKAWALASVTHLDHIASAGAKLAQAPFRRFSITGLGHSLMFGYWSQDDGTKPASDPRLRQRGVYRVAQENLNRRFGTPNPGEGVITMADSRVTWTTGGGTSAVASVGITAASPGGRRMYLATGQSITLTLTEACTEIWVRGYQQSDAECNPWTYSLDGGADTVVTTAMGFPTTASDTDYWVKFTGLANTTHTLVIKSGSTNLIDIAGFAVWENPTRGIAFQRLAVGGGYLDNTILLSSNGGNPRSNRLTLLSPETDLLIIQFGTNEMTATGEGSGHTPAAYNTWLTDFVNVATNTYNIPVLLVSTCEHQAGSLGSYTENQYYDIHEAIATNNPKVAHWDWRKLPEFASWPTANGLGLMYDTIHTGSKGALLTGLAFEQIIASLADQIKTPLS